MGWVECCGGSPAPSKPHEFRFLKWHITGTKNTSNYIQMSEIKLLDASDNEYDFTGVSGAIVNGTVVDGSFANLFDDRTNTKACVSWSKDYIDIEIDLGTGNTVDVYTYNRFAWYTANDATERDPSTWVLYGANLSDFSDKVVLNQVIGYQATNTRMALAYDDSITVIDGLKTPYLCSSQQQIITLPVYADEDITLKFKLIPLSANGDVTLIGDYFAPSGFLIHSSSTIATLAFRYDTGNPLTFASTPFEPMEIEMSTSDGSIIVNGDTKTSGHTTSYGHYPIHLFGINEGQTNYSGIMLSAMKVYKDGALYMNLQPRKDSSGHGYYYDLIGGQDYYSVTSTNLYYTEI